MSSYKKDLLDIMSSLSDIQKNVLDLYSMLDMEGKIE